MRLEGPDWPLPTLQISIAQRHDVGGQRAGGPTMWVRQHGKLAARAIVQLRPLTTPDDFPLCHWATCCFFDFSFQPPGARNAGAAHLHI